MDKADFIKWAQKLAEGYEASDDVKKRLSNVDLIAIVGPTGVGKTAIIENLEIPFVKSDVTREKRPNEDDESDYHFRDDYLNIINEVKAGDYVQFLVSRSGEFYGTRKDSYPESGLCTMAIVAEAIDSFRALGFRKVIPIYIMPPGYVEWMRRIGANRHRDISERIAESIESIKIAIKDPEYKFVLNDNLELAVEDVKNIMAGKPVDEHRASLAKDTTDVLLEKLGDQDDDEYFSD